MSRERELLERALICIEAGNPICVGREVLSEEIRAYLAEQEVKREALTAEEIEKKYWESFGLTSWTCFVAGVRFAEKHHGITGGEIDG